MSEDRPLPVQLRPAQAKILRYKSGKMGISAVPGSGKTWTLSLLAAKIVAAGELADDQEVLVVTLVNSAVENFYRRVSSFIETQGLLLTWVTGSARCTAGHMTSSASVQCWWDWMTVSRLSTSAKPRVFDKPDPLDGPTFEESLFITPSRLPESRQQELAAAVELACVAAGVTEGVIHAEARINDAGVWLLEIAPRGIGGLCGRVLDTILGMNSAEIVLRHAVGLPQPSQANGSAAGVMMIPIPASGIFLGIDGLEAARAVPHLTAIEITAQPGQLVAPPPEGAGYLGFLFSRAATPQKPRPPCAPPTPRWACASSRWWEP